MEQGEEERGKEDSLIKSLFSQLTVNQGEKAFKVLLRLALHCSYSSLPFSPLSPLSSAPPLSLCWLSRTTVGVAMQLPPAPIVCAHKEASPRRVASLSRRPCRRRRRSATYDIIQTNILFCLHSLRFPPSPLLSSPLACACLCASIVGVDCNKSGV